MMRREVDETCTRCKRKIDPQELAVFDGKSYHLSCLPKRAEEKVKGEEKEPSFPLKIYNRLEASSEDGEIRNLDQVCARIGVEFNCHPNLIDHWVNQLDRAGFLKREHNTVELIERPKG